MDDDTVSGYVLRAATDAAWDYCSGGRSLGDYLTAAYLPRDRRGTREFDDRSDWQGMGGARQDARDHLEAAIREAVEVVLAGMAEVTHG